jgi:hypothetical protein
LITLHKAGYDIRKVCTVGCNCNYSSATLLDICVECIVTQEIPISYTWYIIFKGVTYDTKHFDNLGSDARKLVYHVSKTPGLFADLHAM